LVYNISQDRNDLRSKLFILDGSIPMINTTGEERTKQFQVKKKIKDFLYRKIILGEFLQRLWK
jgi:hypothetical protein